MKRNTFLRKATGLAALPVLGQSASVLPDIDRIRQELLDAWQASEKMTLAIVGQMPDEMFMFKYTPEAMTFTEQWRHCCQFTVGQMQASFGMPNLYAEQKLPKAMTKEQVMSELPRMYAYVRKTIETAPAEKLVADLKFGDHKIPGWRLLYAMENHIIHHRGQCVVYLRLNGITPQGYLGW